MCLSSVMFQTQYACLYVSSIFTGMGGQYTTAKISNASTSLFIQPRNQHCVVCVASSVRFGEFLHNRGTDSHLSTCDRIDSESFCITEALTLTSVLVPLVIWLVQRANSQTEGFNGAVRCQPVDRRTRSVGWISLRMFLNLLDDERGQAKV